MNRCSQTSQANGRSPVCVRLCLSRLAVFEETNTPAEKAFTTSPAEISFLRRPEGCGYLVSGRSFRRDDTDMVSRRCGYAGVCLSCFSGRRHGHTSCTQKAARFWGQKKKRKHSESLCSFCSLDGTSDVVRGGEHGVDPRIQAPVDRFDVHLQAVPTRRSMAALLADKRLFPPMFGSLVHTQLRTGQEGFRTLGTLWNISANVHVD